MPWNASTLAATFFEGLGQGAKPLKYDQASLRWFDVRRASLASGSGITLLGCWPTSSVHHSVAAGRDVSGRSRETFEPLKDAGRSGSRAVTVRARAVTVTVTAVRAGRIFQARYRCPPAFPLVNQLQVFAAHIFQRHNLGSHEGAKTHTTHNAFLSAVSFLSQNN
ncbi:hypothetical protein B0T25DRAFT_320015 [Lasiosphaeria hispida]|uniref:Uncharacterized protein n=1 Tax=Lasiosphaeria hispida TaxID=260671 RepID=A0AAJ0MA21_9PEZI|nr:hypothetical protein B0T25DRAFT_320015 [Lasiosphaeria hispida]